MFCFDIFAGPSSISVGICIVECQCERVNNCNINFSENKNSENINYVADEGGLQFTFHYRNARERRPKCMKQKKIIFKYAVCSVLCGTDFTGIVINIFHFAFDLTSRLRSTGYEKAKREEEEEQQEGTRVKPIESAYRVKVNTNDTYLSA